MPQANIAPNIRTTQTANFQFMIVLTIMGELDRSSFSLANVIVSAPDVTAVAGSGTEHTYNIGDGRTVALSLSSDGEGGNFAIDVSGLPAEMSGSFTVGVTGNVMVDSQSDTLSGPAITINYDTLTSLGASFGTVEYRDGGVIAIPVTFAFDVIAPSKTIFQVTRISGDSVEGIESYIVGEDQSYELIFLLPLDQSGVFTVSANGTVFKTFSGTYDTVTLKPILVPWSRKVAEISVLGVPEEVSDGIYEVEIETDIPTKGLNINSFSYKILTGKRVLFRSMDLETRPRHPPLVSETDIEEPECFESWERVEFDDVESLPADVVPLGSADYPASRFFLLRFNRQVDDDTHIPEVLFIGDTLE